MVKGFIVYPTYQQEEDSTKVYLFGRLENGESFLTVNAYKPYFYIKEKDLKKAQKLEKIDYEHGNWKTFQDEPVVKITLKFPKDVPPLRKKFEENNIECYEADIRFVYRYLIDMNIKGSVEIKGDFKKGEYVDRVYEDPELKTAEWIPTLNVLSVDIETNADASQIYCIALHTPNFSKVIVVNKHKLADAISVGSEEELLQKQPDPESC